MKVLCIQDSSGPIVTIIKGMIDIPSPDVKCGEWYTIVKIIDSVKYPGTKSYFLAEMTPWNCYNEKYFAPLSNIDETEMIRENIKEKV